MKLKEGMYTPREFKELMHYCKLIGIKTAEELKNLEAVAAKENKKSLDYIKDYYYDELGGDNFKLKEALLKVENGLKYIKNKGLKESMKDHNDDFNSCVEEITNAYNELVEKYELRK